MAQINKPSDYFNTKLYTGTGVDNLAITGVGFQPDWVWLKARNQADYHYSLDAVRGVTKCIFQNDTSAESTFADSLKSFDSDGFTLGTSGDLNASSQTMASWNWLANGSGSANTDGSISSTVSANTTSGFSIVKFTASGSGDETVGHGLGVKPKMVITKGLDASSPWNTYNENLNSSAPEDYYLALNSTNASASDSPGVFGAGMTSSVIGVGVGVGFTSGQDYIAYCFAEKKGYSKFGSYTGNASTDGPFIFTGFKPAFFLFKRTDAVKDWHIIDAARDVDNPTQTILYPNLSDAEGTPTAVDFLSNGIKIRNGGSFVNEVNGTYIYMAFAEEPLVGTNNIPATAR